MKLVNEGNIDNVLVNRLITPVVFIGYFLVSLKGDNYIDSAQIAGYSSLIYFFCSRFFQPDLDNTPHRPGKYSFPLSTNFINLIASFLKKALKIFRVYSNKGSIITAILFVIRPISIAWYIAWEPYALSFTHRGLSHLPVVGTITRLVYLYVILIGFDHLCNTNVSHFLANSLPIPYDFGYKNLVFEFDLKTWIYYFSPIYLSDIVHSFFDLLEAKAKGNSFIPSKSEPGFISKVLRLIGIRVKL